MTTLDVSLWANPVKEGSLLKKGHVRKNWKWRWFRLQEKNLFYFRTRDPGERPLGHLDLNNYMVKKTPSNSRPYGFGLFSPQFPPYPLAALDEGDYQDWLKYLKIATKGSSKPKDTPLIHKEKSSREIGISKCHTDPVTSGTFVNSMPPQTETRTRNRSISSGDTRTAANQNKIPPKRTHTKHLSLVSPIKPQIYLQSDNIFTPQEEEVGEEIEELDDPSSEEEVCEENNYEEDSDGEFDIVALIEKKKQIDSQFGGDSEWVRSSPKSENQNCKFVLGESNGNLNFSSSPINTPSDSLLTISPLSLSQPTLTSSSEGAKREINFIRLPTKPLSPHEKSRKDGDFKHKLEKSRTNPNRFSKNVDIDIGYVEDLRRFSMTTGRRLTTEDYDGVDLVTSPEMSPRGEEILMLADMDSGVLQRKVSRSFGLMEAIIEEISEETIVVEDPQDNANKEPKKVSWRAIRRSILPSADLLSLRVKGGNHRGFAQHELAILAEEEEKEKIKRLIDMYLVKGDPLQKYTIAARSIGKGAVGEVFFATNKEDESRVAIKKLQLERRGKNRLPLILREIEIIATSAHENIVRYLETYQIGGELWVVMEYMSYGSMYDLVKLYPRGCHLDESLTAYCIREVIKAVDFLHNKKRIHRDIKVDNILANSEGEVKLADFGTAVQLTFQRLRRTTLAGTPYYMAPELIQRIPYNEKVDIWSIGITVVEIMNGKPPFYELDPREALDAIVMKGVKGLVDSKQSDVIKDFVNNRCLCPKPEDRATTTQLLAHPYCQSASTREQFAKFLLQSTVMYHLEGTISTGGGCTIL